jgi:hypothetical protein
MTELIISAATREDRALLGSNPSARAGAEACWEAANPRLPTPTSVTGRTCFGFQAINPSGPRSTNVHFRATEVTNVKINGAFREKTDVRSRPQFFTAAK